VRQRVMVAFIQSISSASILLEIGQRVMCKSVFLGKIYDGGPERRFVRACLRNGRLLAI
jgi:hypothetical protein